MKITTRYTTNRNGASQCIAKGFGKQTTTEWKPEHSPETNHRASARAFLDIHRPGSFYADPPTRKDNPRRYVFHIVSIPTIASFPWGRIPWGGIS